MPLPRARCCRGVGQSIREWVLSGFEDGHRRVLWVCGPPGVGKSWLASYVCRHGALSPDFANAGPSSPIAVDGGAAGRPVVASASTGAVVACHLIVHDNSDLRDGRRMFCSLAFQLCQSVPGLAAHMVAALGDSGGSLSQKNTVALFDLLFVGPLTALDAATTAAGRAAHPPVIIVIDGLDEVCIFSPVTVPDT